jgi:cellulose synthase/poly-beta-1,6-N-acetylglucosamine synthase-like glycosyltransferase
LAGVVYVGDRKKKSVQLNGKSANINHVIASRIYPSGVGDIPESDVLMIMDCDHLVTRDFFNKVCAVMIDPRNAVCLVPQAFHNALEPDFLDNANKMFMYGLLPYFFGLGSTFITGTNFLVRSRAAFHAAELDADKQIFSEKLVAEDVHLGSRLHFLGYRSVVLSEELAYGEVPLPPREIFKQRNRWAKAGHMYILDKHSVFRRSSPYMGWYSKLTYCTPLIIHVLSFVSEPVTILAPSICLLSGLCPYGMSRSLWISHVLAMGSGVVLICLPTFCKPWRFVYNHVSNRVQLMVSMKAVVNTVLVLAKLKKPGRFKTSVKSGSEHLSLEVSARPSCLPYDGTIDIWYIVSVCVTSLFAACVGLRKLYMSDELTSTMGSSQSNLYLLSIVFCLWESVPGLCFIWYCLLWELAPWTLRVWIPLVCGTISLMIVFIEMRLGYQYLGGPWDTFHGYDV